MTKVLIFENIPENFEPNVTGCEMDCPIGIIDWTDCDTVCQHSLFDTCPFVKTYDKRIEKHKDKIINILESR